VKCPKKTSPIGKNRIRCCSNILIEYFPKGFACKASFRFALENFFPIACWKTEGEPRSLGALLLSRRLSFSTLFCLRGLWLADYLHLSHYYAIVLFPSYSGFFPQLSTGTGLQRPFLSNVSGVRLPKLPPFHFYRIGLSATCITRREFRQSIVTAIGYSPCRFPGSHLPSLFPFILFPFFPVWLYDFFWTVWLLGLHLLSPSFSADVVRSEFLVFTGLSENPKDPSIINCKFASNTACWYGHSFVTSCPGLALSTFHFVSWIQICVVTAFLPLTISWISLFLPTLIKWNFQPC